MSARRVLIVVLACLASLLATPAAHAGQAPSEARWNHDVSTAMKGANGYLDRQAVKGGALAINLDIDNTSLATHYAPGKAVGPVLRAARHAHQLGIKVFFNTGRLHAQTGHVAQQLTSVGFTVDGLCSRNNGERVKHSKKRCRDQEAAQGYKIVANIGNSPTDFLGRHQGRKFELPNYHGALS